jgi:hypothetical protein
LVSVYIELAMKKGKEDENEEGNALERDSRAHTTENI